MELLNQYVEAERNYCLTNVDIYSLAELDDDDDAENIRVTIEEVNSCVDL